MFSFLVCQLRLLRCNDPRDRKNVTFAIFVHATQYVYSRLQASYTAASPRPATCVQTAAGENTADFQINIAEPQKKVRKRMEIAANQS